MKRLYVVTGAGTTIVPPNSLVPVVENGRVEEKYASEMKEGDVVLYKGQYAPVRLDEVISILYGNVPGYREARDFCYRENIPKLQDFLLRGVASKYPELFKDDELKDLDAIIFADDLSHLSRERISKYLQDVLDSHDISYSQDAIKDWLGGRVIYPQHPDAVPVIAYELEYDEMFDWGNHVSDTPKSDNEYQKLVTAHRTATSILAQKVGNNGHGSGCCSSSSGRVFEELPEWHRIVVDQLGARIREYVVESPISKVSLCDENGSNEEPVQSTGLKKGVLVYNGDDKRDETFSRLRMQKPEKRVNRLERAIQESSELFHSLCESVAALYSEYITTHGSNGIYCLTGESIPNTSMIARSLSPLFEYSLIRVVSYSKNVLESLSKLSTDRQYRRTFLRENKKRLSRNHPIYPIISNAYDSSLLLQSLFEKSFFINNVCQEEREAAVRTIEKIRKAQVHIRKSVSAYIESDSLKSFHDVLYWFEENPDYMRGVQRLKTTDRDVPQEILMFRSIFSSRITTDYENTFIAKEMPEFDIFKRICEAYGLDPSLVTISLSESLGHLFRTVSKK